MLDRNRQIVLALVVTSAALFIPFTGWAGKAKVRIASSAMSERKRVVHALNRLTFGARPGDIEQVTAMGVDKWIELQLHPEKIDDNALQARLAPFRTLRMNTREIFENFPPPPVIRAVADRKQSLPSDPTKRAIYVAQLDRFEQRQTAKQKAANDTPSAVDSKSNESNEAQISNAPRADGAARVDELLDMPPDQRAEAVLRMSPEERQSVLGGMKGKRDELLEGMSPQQRETTLALQNPQQVVADELVQGKLIHATYSERQLDEVMADFWFNHFNVFIGKGQDRYFLGSYERDVIRPHALGKFEDLLVATAESPAMLFYLDNWLSVGPDSDVARGIPQTRYGYRRRWPRNEGAKQPSKNKRNGLNENYGRELMELHTLGVNGGYTQKDVTEVARVFTGWTLKQPRQGGGFHFDERLHEPGDKMVLGHRIKSNGQQEGLEVLHLLAHNPATAKFVCSKLATRFVSDDPPANLVTRMSETFLKKGGDIREVLTTLFSSPEFWASDAYRAKVKTPLEFVVSSLRASGADVSDATPVARQLQNMGMPLYGMQPPTGYSMKASTWVNSSALLGRMNFALALTGGRLRGVQIDSAMKDGGRASSPVNENPSHVLLTLENALLAGDVSQQTHNTIAARLQDEQVSQRKLDDPARPPNVSMIEGLLLASPEFQRR